MSLHLHTVAHNFIIFQDNIVLFLWRITVNFYYLFKAANYDQAAWISALLWFLTPREPEDMAEIYVSYQAVIALPINIRLAIIKTTIGEVF